MILSFFLLFCASANALPNGAPTKVCNTMLPFHGGGIQRQLSPPPYGLTTYRRNGTVYVILKSPIEVPFEGFMLQARSLYRDLLGTFQSSSDLMHSISCEDSGDALTHSNTMKKNSVEVWWMPPRGYEGDVVFNATIAQDYSTFWVGIESTPVSISRRIINDPGFEEAFARPKAMTTPANFIPRTFTSGKKSGDSFYNGCAETKTCFGYPKNCESSMDCLVAVAVTVTSDDYVFEIQATKGYAWGAAGLSDDEKMGDDSVMECIRTDSGARAHMSYTTAAPYGSVRLRNTQQGIQLLNSSITDDVVYCRIRRDTVTTVNNVVYDLAKTPYHFVVAVGNNLGESGLYKHDRAIASGDSVFLANVSSLKAASKTLLQLHGCFMIAAWIGTASIGMLIARYFRHTWVGSSVGGKDVWFAWHRILMVSTWLLVIIGFIFIFLYLDGPSFVPHAILGFVANIICFLQPIGAYFRPHPGTPRRPIFNWIHWLGGNTAHIVAIVAIFFAVKLTKAELPDWFDWIMVGYVAFHVVVHLMLSILNCFAEKSPDVRVTSFPMKDFIGPGRIAPHLDKKTDAPYSGFRKTILVIYIVGVIVFAVALIVVVFTS